METLQAHIEVLEAKMNALLEHIVTLNEAAEAPKPAPKRAAAAASDEEKPARKENPWVEFQRAYKGQLKGMSQEEKKEIYLEWKEEHYPPEPAPEPLTRPVLKKKAESAAAGGGGGAEKPAEEPKKATKPAAKPAAAAAKAKVATPPSVVEAEQEEEGLDGI
jgi:hypothetical protein